jgi:hypothetical protein
MEIGKVIKLFITVAVMTACGAGKKTTGDDTAPSSGSNPLVGDVTAEAFYVRVYENGKFPHFMSELGDFSSACEISAATKGSSLDCLVDIPELDLYFGGITFQYNFPASMCAYSLIKPYWYYNFETGTGPSTASVTVTTVAGVVTGTACVIDGVAGCTGLEASYSSLTQSFRCQYDHSLNPGYPNCCLGNYQYTNTQIVDGVPSSTSTPSAWGGDAKTCIGGAGKSNWEHYTKDGYPVGRLEYIEGKGANDKYEVTAPIKLANDGLIVSVANYYKPYDAASTNGNHRHTGYVDARSTDLPYMVDPVDDRSGSTLAKYQRGQPSYLFQCLDRNREVINQIQVYVREWNTYEQFLLYGTSMGVSGDPDTTGDEGVDCDYQTGAGNCDDFTDLDYFKGPNASSLRYLYFPSSLY